MTQTTSRFVGARNHAALTVTATIFLSVLAVAQQSPGPGGAPGSGGSDEAEDTSHDNKLRFPYGVQNFERIKAGHSISEIPGWSVIGSPMVTANVDQSKQSAPRPGGTYSRRWLCVDDQGSVANMGFRSPVVRSPAPWNYGWSFELRLDTAPTGGNWPVLSIMHPVAGAYQDAWGIELTDTGANLFVTNIWGAADSRLLFPYSGETSVGDWIHVRVVASLDDNRLEAFVNGVSAAWIPMNPPEQTDVTRQRLAYHGTGTGNFAVLDIDNVGVAFTSAVCKETLSVDFSTEDDNVAPLVNGQDVASPDEFGDELTLNSAGPNNGAAIFDSSNPGPNAPSQDLDLLVNQGNILILQNDDSAQSGVQTVAGIFDLPNDDDDGGTIDIVFNRPSQPLSVDVIDIDNRPGEGVVVTESDFNGLTRTYTVPADWTGDITLAQPGVGTLDLTALVAQPGPNAGSATVVEDVGFNPNAVLSMTIAMGGSGGIDNLEVCIPCVLLDFEFEDDGTPNGPGTAIANGQDLSTPPEFGVEVALTSAGPNAGSAAFDSTPGGPNFPGPDNDLLVGLGNILILQNDQFATQTVPGFFDIPNDDTNGGDQIFDFPNPITAHFMDLIDVDEEEAVGVTVTLEDSSGDVRVYSVPPGWTEDLLNDGPPGFRTLDLTSLAPQPGWDPPGAPVPVNATAVEDPTFDPTDVVQVVVTMGGAQDMDNFCFCP